MEAERNTEVGPNESALSVAEALLTSGTSLSLHTSTVLFVRHMLIQVCTLHSAVQLYDAYPYVLIM